jgi:hypothetical protein
VKVNLFPEKSECFSSWWPEAKEAFEIFCAGGQPRWRIYVDALIA